MFTMLMKDGTYMHIENNLLTVSSQSDVTHDTMIAEHAYQTSSYVLNRKQQTRVRFAGHKVRIIT
jgi:hypothetical protein